MNNQSFVYRNSFLFSAAGGCFSWCVFYLMGFLTPVSNGPFCQTQSLLMRSERGSCGDRSMGQQLA